VISLILAGDIVTAVVKSSDSAPHHATDQEASSGVVEESSNAVTYTDDIGHFRARFPRQPVVSAQPGSFGPISFRIRLAVTREPLAEVEWASLSQALPADAFDLTLRSAVDGFTSASGFTLDQSKVTTFQGHPAQEARLSRRTAGLRITMIAFFYDAKTMYLLVGADGQTWNDLKSSFVVLPS
jgi:hypothetical protein